MAAMSAAAAVPRGLRRLFSTTIASTFMPPPPTSPGLLVERFLGSAKVLLEKSCGRHFPSLVKLSMEEQEVAEEGIPEEAQAPAPQAPPQTLEDLLWKENEALKKDEGREGWSSYLKKAWKGVMGLWGRARGRGPPAEQAPPGGPEGGPPAEQGGYPDPPHWPDS